MIAKNKALFTAHSEAPQAFPAAKMVLADFGRQFEVGAEESRSQFVDQFRHRVAFVAESLATKGAVETRRVQRPMRGLVGQRCVIALGVAEKVDARRVHVVGRRDITGPAAAMHDVDAGRGKDGIAIHKGNIAAYPRPLSASVSLRVMANQSRQAPWAARVCLFYEIPAVKKVGLKKVSLRF